MRDKRNRCLYCGHTPGCYCACPTREGHKGESLRKRAKALSTIPDLTKEEHDG